MLTQSSRSLPRLLARCRTIPVIESRMQFVQALDSSEVEALLLRHCNVFELKTLLKQAFQRRVAVYVNVDHIDGIHPDAAGLHYLQAQFSIAGVVSNHPKTLALAKSFELETIQRIFAVDSTGLEMALDSVDPLHVDVLDISPALVVPYVVPRLMLPLPLPFIASGLISTIQQVQAVLDAGAVGVAVTRRELWPV